MSDPGGTAFVQINLEFSEARQRGDISGGAYSLGLHLACLANFMSRRVTVTLAGVIDDLGWECTTQTVRRRLIELRDRGFVGFEAGSRRGYRIHVGPRLLDVPSPQWGAS